ncbi:hypothetical protein [Halomonas daqiaonensis]|uniref:O-antigen ligase like membrane protein n=1 Tax=Halomonas daqiaonensis TaxID=650850 RepID=A0A1H7HIK1_9GAMM|nr:hypothetical protein [Halomonas daqiaonensis]SEK50203.1 hypothetical protein SAMN04488129_102230 [Halomonas daqiaonensis]
MSAKRLQNFAVAYIAIWTISPPLFVSGSARLLVVMATVIWMVLEILRHDGLARRITLPVLMTLLFIGYTGLNELMLSGVEGVVRNTQIWIMLFFLVVWQSRQNDLKSLVSIFWLVLAVYPVWLFITIQTIVTVNDHAARIIVRSSPEALELSLQGVGGYTLVYGTLLLIPALIGMVNNPRTLRGDALPQPLHVLPRISLALVVLNLAMGVALVLTAGFSLAVIALAGILLSVTFLKSFTATRLLITVFATLFFSILARPILDVTLSALLPLAEGTNFVNKIRDVLASFQQGDAVGTAADRIQRYMRSLRLFVENPLIGVLSFDNTGKHSAILDNFARWGVFFGSVFVYLVTFPAVRVMCSNKRYFGVGLSMLAAVAVIFGMNNGFAAAGLMLYIMFPVSLHILSANRAQQSPRDEVVAHA